MFRCLPAPRLRHLLPLLLVLLFLPGAFLAQEPILPAKADEALQTRIANQARWQGYVCEMRTRLIADGEMQHQMKHRVQFVADGRLEMQLTSETPLGKGGIFTGKKKKKRRKKNKKRRNKKRSLADKRGEQAGSLAEP